MENLLEREIDSFFLDWKKNPNRKALCLVRMGTGMRNAVGFYWPLTEYHYANDFPVHDKEKALKCAEELFSEALDIVKNYELGAELNLRLYRWKTVATRYPNF